MHVSPITRLCCPLCAHGSVFLFHRDRQRSYYRCLKCELVFVPPEEHLSTPQEKARYDQHSNKTNDPGYRHFLSRIFKPLQKHIPPPAAGLDFGCGPGPALAAMCQEAGYDMDTYDPFYAQNPIIWGCSYDFITCTEVVEHMRRPGRTILQIWDILRPGGWLGIMTKRIISREAFVNWHYIRDQTHISFFSQATFFWLANSLQAGILFDGNDVIFLHKPA